MAKPQGFKRILHHVGEAPGMPDIGDLAGKQRPGRAPVGTLVIGHLAHLAGIGIDPGPFSPSRIVIHAIRRVGDHQMRMHTRKQALDRLSTPDRLDHLLTLTSRRSWLALAAAGVVLAAALVWSLAGSESCAARATEAVKRRQRVYEPND